MFACAMLWEHVELGINRSIPAVEKNRQVDIDSLYFSGWRSKVCLHPAQQK